MVAQFCLSESDCSLSLSLSLSLSWFISTPSLSQPAQSVYPAQYFHGKSRVGI